MAILVPCQRWRTHRFIFTFPWNYRSCHRFKDPYPCTVTTRISYEGEIFFPVPARDPRGGKILSIEIFRVTRRTDPFPYTYHSLRNSCSLHTIGVRRILQMYITKADPKSLYIPALKGGGAHRRFLLRSSQAWPVAIVLHNCGYCMTSTCMYVKLLTL
jgi:hypothetical protein